MNYPHYESLVLDRPADGVLRITLSRGAMNGMDYRMHNDLAEVWRLVDDDPQTSVAIVTGQGRAFSAGADMDMVDDIVRDHIWRERLWKDGSYDNEQRSHRFMNDGTITVADRASPVQLKDWMGRKLPLELNYDLPDHFSGFLRAHKRSEERRVGKECW